MERTVLITKMSSCQELKLYVLYHSIVKNFIPGTCVHNRGALHSGVLISGGLFRIITIFNTVTAVVWAFQGTYN